MQALHTSLHCYVNEQVSITIPLLVHIKQEDLRGEEQSAVLKLGQQRSVITNHGLDGVTTYLKFCGKACGSTLCGLGINCCSRFSYSTFKDHY